MNKLSLEMDKALEEVNDHLKNGIIPFWLNNGIDKEYGGFFTCFNSNCAE
ncbi:hypothetical protein ACJROX_27230 [Pseudalkalibacillus sp. A8]